MTPSVNHFDDGNRRLRAAETSLHGASDTSREDRIRTPFRSPSSISLPDLSVV